MSDKDIFAQATGNFGRWQLRAVLIIFLCKIPTSWFMAVIIYTAPAPQPGDFWCRPTQPEHDKWKHLYHPVLDDGNAGNNDRRPIFDYCTIYQDMHRDPLAKMDELIGRNVTDFHAFSANDSVVKCDDFVFDRKYRSLIVEYSLVCDRKYLVALSQCFHIFGLLLGGICAYKLLKMYSPRRIMLAGMLLQIVFGLLCGLSGHFALHVLFRCLTAIACALMYSSGQMIMGDITNGRAKIMVTTLFELFWSIGLIMLPAFSIFFDYWANLYLVISLPTIGLVCLHRMIPDSPRWMVQNGRIDKAAEILRKSAKVNDRDVPKDLITQLQLEAATSSGKPTATLIQLWRDYPKKLNLIIVHYAWSIFILLFNSMVLNINAYGQQHIHMNTVVMALSEIVGLSIGLYLIMYQRRKWLLSGLLCISSGLFANIVWIIPATMNYTHVVALTMIPCIAIKITTSSAMSVLTTCTGDLISAERRKVLMLSTAIWARTWFMWAPYIGNTSAYGMLVPLTIFATLSVAGGFLFLMIHGIVATGEKSKLKANILVEIEFEKDGLVAK